MGTRRGMSPRAIGLWALWLVVAVAWVCGALGAAWWLVAVLAVVVAAGGSAWSRLGTIREVSRRVAGSRRRRQRMRARRSERIERFRGIVGVLDGVDAPVLATDGTGKVVLANREAVALFGRRGESPVGLALDDLFAPGDLRAMHDEAAHGRGVRRRVRLIRQGVARVFDVSATEVEGLKRDGRFGVVLMLQDVTELARAMQLKTDFVANASHELRTPLAAIRGAVDTLAELDDNPAMRARLTAMIAQNAARLEDLVRDLLDLSRLESPEAGPRPTRFAMQDVAASMTALFEPALQARSLRLEFAVAPGVEEIETDRRLLELIFKNLIDNACKFAREGTVIRVEARPTQGEPGGARFAVIDQGIGIPMQHQERIFERFYQVDPSRSGSGGQRGTGLGLAIVKHAVRNLGGTVGVESVWQQGTTVWFEIPAPVGEANGRPQFQ